MKDETSPDRHPTYEELLKRNKILEKKLNQVQSKNDYIWSLFSETARGLQLSSTSIKVAVSSLLSHDIFWDPPNQHEFLETINDSTNRITQLVALLTLGFRAEAGNLVLNPEPQVIQEILAIIHQKTKNRFQDLDVELVMSSSEKTVHIDYEYVIMAIMYLIDFMHQRTDKSSVKIVADERGGLWFVDLLGFNQTAIKQIHNMRACKPHRQNEDQMIGQPEKILGLHIACEILQHQDIENVVIEKEGITGLRLIFPAVSV